MEVLSRNLRKIGAAVSGILDAERHLQGLGPAGKPSRMHERYEMADSMKEKLVIGSFIQEHPGDPAVKVRLEREGMPLRSAPCADVCLIS